jgi:hypothetical protein
MSIDLPAPTSTKPRFRPGVCVKNGKLYAFSDIRVIVVRGWPEMSAWTKTCRRPHWSRFRPHIDPPGRGNFRQAKPSQGTARATRLLRTRERRSLSNSNPRRPGRDRNAELYIWSGLRGHFIPSNRKAEQDEQEDDYWIYVNGMRNAVATINTGNPNFGGAYTVTLLERELFVWANSHAPAANGWLR